MIVFRLTPAGVKKLEQLEGDKLVAYYDSVGKLTIGKGHTGPDVKKGMKITQAQSDALFQRDEPKYWKPVIEMMPPVPVPQNVLEGQFFFSYNIGPVAYKTSSAAQYFKSMRVFNSETIDQLGKLMKRYNKGRVKGKLVVLPGLVNRRSQEVAWMKGKDKTTTFKQKAAGVAAVGGAAVTAVDQSGLTDTVDNTGTLQSIVDSSAMFGMTGSTILAAIGSVIVVAVLAYIVYTKFSAKASTAIVAEGE